MMFRVKTSITGGFEPGELRSADELKAAGCDVRFLTGNGSLEPLDGIEPRKGEPTPESLMGEVEELTDKLADRTSEMKAAVGEKARLAEKVEALEAELAEMRKPVGDGLEDKTVAELRELAEREKIDLGDATRKADVVAAVRLAREPK